MPIRYRCPECQQLISIATRMAGTEVPCPQCRTVSPVPFTDDPSLPPPPGAASLPPSFAPPENPDSPVEQSSSASEPSQGPSQAPTEASATSENPPLENVTPVETPPAIESTGSAEPSRRRRQPAAETSNQEFRLRRAKTEFDDMDLTPMVDVTFLLLIFFMITASFSLQKTIEIPAPDPDSKGAAQSLTLEDLEDNTVMVRIDAENGIYVDDVPLPDRGQLVEALSQTRLTTFRNELAIDADAAALHETVVAVIDGGTAAGMSKIRLISRSTSDDGG